jgi:hypothetical protein
MLELPGGQRIPCANFDDARTYWEREFASFTDAVIDSYSLHGAEWSVVSFQYDVELEKWVLAT